MKVSDDSWCKTDFSFRSAPLLNYAKENDEVLLAREVDELAQSLEKLLSDKLDGPMEFTCIESDFVFIINPKEDLRNNPCILYIRPECEFSDTSMEWQIHFWDDGLTADYLSATHGQEEIEYLLIYLKLVTG